MSPSSALTQENIWTLENLPLDKGSTAFLRAIDKLLTVGAYYSTDHAQYKAVSEEVCGQILASMEGAGALALEITAKGLMIRSQIVDPHQRKVRQLHELLVPLNVARLEFRRGLTPDDLRLAVQVLQERRRTLGTTTGFREIVIDGLPPTVMVGQAAVAVVVGFLLTFALARRKAVS